MTTGTDRDVAYLVVVDSGPAHLLLAASGTLSIDSLPHGTHALRVGGVAPNCILDGPAVRSITVLSGVSTQDTITVSCVSVVRRLVFGSDRDGNYDLYVMDANGANTVRLTTDTAYHGSWSPDGSRLVYMSPRSGVDHIYVANADGTNPIRLTSDSADHDFPQWSPDGSQIAYSVSYSVWVMGADGTHKRQVGLAGGTFQGPSWSPDGNRLAFGGADGQVSVMNADGTHIVQLTNGQGYYSTSPVWSPDGSMIAFTSDRDGAFSDIYVMQADGSNIVRLTQSPAGIFNEQMAWSPDGTQIAFRTNRDTGHPEVYVMNADGTNQVNISQNIWDNYGPSWYP